MHPGGSKEHRGVIFRNKRSRRDNGVALLAKKIQVFFANIGGGNHGGIIAELPGLDNGASSFYLIAPPPRHSPFL